MSQGRRRERYRKRNGRTNGGKGDWNNEGRIMKREKVGKK
jgi:hypothetical protein